MFVPLSGHFPLPPPPRPRYLRGLLQVLVQILPSQWHFSCPSYLKAQSPRLPVCLLSIFLQAHQLESYYTTSYLSHSPSLEWSFLRARLLSVLFTAVFPVPRTVPAKCQALSINCMNTRLHLPHLSASCLSTKTKYSCPFCATNSVKTMATVNCHMALRIGYIPVSARHWLSLTDFSHPIK